MSRQSEEELPLLVLQMMNTPTGKQASASKQAVPFAGKGLRSKLHPKGLSSCDVLSPSHAKPALDEERMRSRRPKLPPWQWLVHLDL